MNSISDGKRLKQYLAGPWAPQAVRALKRLLATGLQQVPMPEMAVARRFEPGWRKQFVMLKCAIAADPFISPAVLARLAASCEPEVQEKIAENRRTDPRILADLASSPHVRVRMAVATNPNADLATVVGLAYDESPDVRLYMAGDHNMSPEILKLLAADSDSFVSWRARRRLMRLRPA